MKGKQPYYSPFAYNKEQREIKELRDKVNDLELRLDKLITILYKRERFGVDYASRDKITSTSYSGKNEFEDLLPNSSNNT